MTQNQLEARDALEKYYSSLIKVLEDEKSNYEEEKKKYISSIATYKKKVRENQQKINDILSKKESFINENNLTPESFHEKNILEKKQKLYEKIVLYLEKNNDQNSAILNEHIIKCQNNIDKYNKEIELIKKAIWNEGMVKIKINEVIDLKELKEYFTQNEMIISRFNN